MRIAVRPCVPHAALAAAAMVSSYWERRRWRRRSHARCEASAAAIKRDFFIFQNSYGLQDYAHKGWIGDGGFSSVSLAIHKRTGQPRAIKKICKRNTHVEEFEGELQALISLNHPHIVKLLEYFEDAANYYVVLELCTGKDLLLYLVENVLFNGEVDDVERVASIIIRQCLKAVVGCHSKGYIHRDLKLENFLLTGKDMTVKLIDFGLTARDGEVKDRAGTRAYMAPESFSDLEDYGQPADIWSLGIMLYVLLKMELPFPDGEEEELLKDDTYVRQRINALSRNSPVAIDLLKRMLEWHPHKRITALEVLEHPFIKQRCRELLCDRSQLSISFDQIDRHLPSKMERYSKSPVLRQIGLRCLVHLASAASLPDDLAFQLLTAQHRFRNLNPTGTGQVNEHQLRARLEMENVHIPENFGEICSNCQHASHGTEAVLYYDVLVACILVDATWPDALLREVFVILDRSRDGVVEVDDLIKLARTEHPSECEVILQQVDPEGDRYVNYDKFMKIMEVGAPLFQWKAP